MNNRSPTAAWICRHKGKTGTTYRVRWVDPRSGRWRSRTAGRDYVAARLLRGQVRADLRDGLAGKRPDVSPAELADRLPILMAGRAATTIRKTAGSLRQLQKLCDVHRIEWIDREAIMRFKAARLAAGLSPATVNINLRQIRSALSYAVDAELLRANPLLRWKALLLKVPERAVRVVEEPEFAALVGSCDWPTLAALLVVAYRQGLRRTELVNLRWTAVGLDRGLLQVVNVPEAGEFTKSRKSRTIPMHPAVAEALGRLWAGVPKRIAGGRVVPKIEHVFTWPDGKPFRADWLSVKFAALVRSAGIAHCTLHDLRRSFSTLAQRAGVDRSLVKDLGGWSCLSVVEKHYTGDVTPALRRAMRRIAGTA